MEVICPLCNGLREAEEYCPHCNGIMEDTGSIENYYDNYSPYLDKNITQLLNNTGDPMNCVHLFQCSRCGYDTRINVSMEFH